MKNLYRHNKKMFLLGFVVFVYSLLILPLLVINLQKQQDTRSKAQTANAQTETVIWATTQTATTVCSLGGQVQLGVSFTNTEASQSMNVLATDTATNKSVNLGTVGPQETKTGTILPGTTSVGSGSVSFSLTYSTNPPQTESRTAIYQGLSCSAPTPTPIINAACGNVPSDIILVIDRSGSMGHYNKLVTAKSAAKNFIDIVGQDTRNRISLVSFSTTGRIDYPLTSDYSAVKSKIDSLSALGFTCQQCAANRANEEIGLHGRPGIKKVVILLTDGQANWLEGGSSSVTASVAEQKALDAVRSGFYASKTSFFAIGLGNPKGTGDEVLFSADFLQGIASATGGKYYFPLPDELNGVYQEISQLIGKGILGGFVFQDVNMNKTFDAGEPKLSGWTINLTSPTYSQFSKSFVTSSTGGFSATGLCDGTYSIKEVPQTGWVQTSPADPNGYTVNISNASQYTDKNFGNAKTRCSDLIDNDSNGFIDSKDSSCHTDGNPSNPGSYDPIKDGEKGGNNTCGDSKDNNGNGLIDGADPICHTDGKPGDPKTYDPNLPELKVTRLSLTVLLDGIGSRGDNSNPDASSLSNKNPLHATKSADVQILNAANEVVALAKGDITYDKVKGDFKGIVTTKDALTDGIYTIKVKSERYLRRRVSGIVNILSGKDNTIATVALVTGDINNDNTINILDYNLLLDCYSDLTAPANCRESLKKDCSDINDDGGVNQVDYNLFLREISTQPGA